jgi:hypothetical protein
MTRIDARPWGRDMKRLKNVGVALSYLGVGYFFWSLFGLPYDAWYNIVGPTFFLANLFLLGVTTAIVLRAHKVLPATPQNVGMKLELSGAAVILLVLLIIIGEFNRGERSPIPWAAYHNSANRNNVIAFLWATNSCMVVFLTDVWILFGIACYAELWEQRIIEDSPKQYLRGIRMKRLERRRALYYIANIIFGVMLMK